MNASWDQCTVIERNRQAMLAIVAALLSIASLSAAPNTLPRHLHRTILRLLRPAESAARRLVIVLAQGLAVPAIVLRPYRWVRRRRGVQQKSRSVSLPLFDRFKAYRPQRAVEVATPRISLPGLTPLFVIAQRPAPRADDAVDATRIHARLAALRDALDDPSPYAARMARWHALRAQRLARWQARTDAARPRNFRVSPLRPGRGPGQLSPSTRSSARHAVHEILAHSHELAMFAMERHDTS